MPQNFRPASFLLTPLMVAAASAQGPAPWKDPSPHKTHFVKVEQNVELEVLDWGGTGRPIVLLAGGGSTAHVFDGFAPKLAPRWHVYGITRRGFGASGFSTAGDLADRLGDDVVAVIDKLKMDKPDRPVLAGHSIGGVEMSSVANRHPGRIAGLVYLDAAYSYAFDNGKGSDAREAQALPPPQPPPPGAADLASFATLQKYFERVDGFPIPEAEWRQQWEPDGAGKPARPRNHPGAPALGTMFMTATKKYASIPVPALVIFANPHSLGAWADGNADASIKAAVETASATFTALTARQEKAVRDAVPAARVVVLPHAHHFVFLSHEADVLREMNAFVLRLK